MKLLLENWREFLNENQEIWYHGGKIEGETVPLYLSADEALASMHGELYSFKISQDATSKLIEFVSWDMILFGIKKIFIRDMNKFLWQTQTF